MNSEKAYALIHELLALGIQRFTSDDQVLVEITSALEALAVKEDAQRSTEQLKISTKKLAARTQAVEWRKTVQGLKDAKLKADEALDEYISAVSGAGEEESKRDKGVESEQQKKAAAALGALGKQFSTAEKARIMLV